MKLPFTQRLGRNASLFAALVSFTALSACSAQVGRDGISEAESELKGGIPANAKGKGRRDRGQAGSLATTDDDAGIRMRGGKAAGSAGKTDKVKGSKDKADKVKGPKDKTDKVKGSKDKADKVKGPKDKDAGSDEDIDEAADEDIDEAADEDTDEAADEDTDEAADERS